MSAITIDDIIAYHQRKSDRCLEAVEALLSAETTPSSKQVWLDMLKRYKGEYERHTAYVKTLSEVNSENL